MTKRRLPWYKKLGPGIITGAADDDPSGIATYSQTGAQYGTGMLWASLFMLPLLVSIQEAAARIGLVTGKGLAGNLVRHYPKIFAFVLILLLVIANTANLGADLGAIAVAVQLLIPIPFIPLVIGVGIFVVVLTVMIPYKKYASILKVLTLSLLAYFVTGFMVFGDGVQALKDTVFPHIQFDYSFLFLLVGVAGTTISPYMMFWQSNEEVEEEHAMHLSPKQGMNPRLHSVIKSMRFDVIAGMFFAELATWFIIYTTAQTLHVNGITEIATAAQAAEALEPFAGSWAKAFFALGIVGTGLLAVPIFAASNAYAVSELFGWNEGLNKSWRQAKPFYIIVAVSVVLGMLMSLLQIDPIKALVYVAVLNGIIAVPLIASLMSIGGNKKIMGEYTHPLWVSIFGWLTFIIMGAGAVLLFVLQH